MRGEAQKTPRLAISYRREDSSVITGRIFDRLVARYGRNSVFRDIDNIPAGADFREHINRVLDRSDVVLAMVGPRWAGHRGGQNRLRNPADPVRVEVETALRKKVPLIPVLVLRAEMPKVEQLPESLQEFAYRNALRIDDGQDFDVHITRLLHSIDVILDPASANEDGEVNQVTAPSPQITEATPEPVAPSPGPQRDRAPDADRRPSALNRGRMAALVGVCIVLLIIAGFAASRLLPSGPASRDRLLGETAVASNSERPAPARAAPASPPASVAATPAQPPPVVTAPAPPAVDPARQARLQAEADEERFYASARGNSVSLRAYLSSCRVCAFQAAANGEIAELERTEHRTRSASAVLCGRPVDYIVDRAGASDATRPFLGVWTGGSWSPRICGGLIVERTRSDGTAQITYVYGPSGPANFPWDSQRQPATIENGQLNFQDRDGSYFSFVLTDDNTLFARFVSAKGSKLSAVFKKEPGSAP
jgi:hypothetical protein